MLGATSMIGFVPSVDPDRAGAFYADVLGLTLEEVTRTRASCAGTR